jgi:outer membrane protein
MLNRTPVTLFGVIVGACWLPVPIYAQTLPDLWQRVASSEPTLLAATAQTRATIEREKQTYSQFLPQVNLTGNTTQNHRKYDTTGNSPSFSDDRYNSRGVQLNLVQPLWKQVNHVAHQQALEASEQSRQQLLVAQQELLNKLVSTWAETLYARDALRAAQTLETAAQQQFANYERGLALGLYAVNQRDEARAKRQQAIADRYVAESELFARHTALEQLTGPLPPMGSEGVSLEMQKFPFGTLLPLVRYTETLGDVNPTIKVAEQALKVAREEVRKQQAQHSPTLDLVAGVGRTAQPSAGTTPNQPGFKSRLDTLGLQFNMPLYSGGFQTSKVQEAVALETKAQYELESARRNAHSQAGQAWAQLRSAQAKLEAAEQALAAGFSSERVAIVGQKTGTKTPLDELQAKQQIETARRDARRAYYDNIIGMAKLLTAAGEIEIRTLEDIQKRLKQPSTFTEIPAIALLLKLTTELKTKESGSR